MFFKSNKLGIIWSLVIIVICIVPGSNDPGMSFLNSLGVDKVIHGFIHLVLVNTLVSGLLKQTTFFLTKGKAFFIALLYSLLLGLLIEIVQSKFILGRSGDVYDILANAIGAIVGVLLHSKLQRFKVFKA